MEEGEKNSSRTSNHGAGRIINHVETFFTQKPGKSVEGKPYGRNTVKARFVPGWTDFFLVPFKESRFPLHVTKLKPFIQTNIDKPKL